jgi:DNA mismatch repair protein MutL
LKIALCRNDVRFVFYDEDSLVFDVHKSTTEERIKVLLGDLIYDSILKVDFEYQGVRIWGYIGQPHLAKTSRGGQYLYLNGRSIKSRALTYAVFLAYEHLLEKQTNPFFFLNIELDPKKFDVNVHPQKQEVKFEDDKFIFNLINTAVNKTLTENNLAPSVAVSSFSEPFRKVEMKEEGQPPSIQLVNKMTGEVVDEKFQFGSTKVEYYNKFRSNVQSKLSYLPPQKGSSPVDYSDLFVKHAAEEDIESKPWKNVFQVHNKYIIVEKENGILLVDQHAAHERILYEKAAKSLELNMGNSQQILFPLVIQFNPVELSAIKEIYSELQKIGFRFEIRLNGEVEIFEVPSDIVNREEENIIREIVSMYIETSKINQSTKRDNLLASYSCKAAIKTGQKLTNEEMKSLLLELFNCSIPYACPHGRPVLIELTLEELDKNFCRIL